MVRWSGLPSNLQPDSRTNCRGAVSTAPRVRVAIAVRVDTLSPCPSPISLSDGTPNFQLDFERPFNLECGDSSPLSFLMGHADAGFRDNTAWPLSAGLCRSEHCPNWYQVFKEHGSFSFAVRRNPHVRVEIYCSPTSPKSGEVHRLSIQAHRFRRNRSTVAHSPLIPPDTTIISKLEIRVSITMVLSSCIRSEISNLKSQIA